MAKSKAPKIVMTPEEIEAKRIADKMENNRRYITDHLEHVPYPPEHRILQVGDAVTYGAIDDCVVKEVCDNGRYYLVHYIHHKKEYGKPVTDEGDRYIRWLDVFSVGDVSSLRNKTNMRLIDTDERLNYLNMDVNGLLSRFYYFGVDMDPKYQRGYVWELEDKQALIESIMTGMDIGKFVFRHLEYNDREDHIGNEIIDGKQRLKAIIEFYEDRFMFMGLYFSQFSHREKHIFLDCPVAVCELKYITDRRAMEVFVRVNKHGKVMDKEHLQIVENMLL